MSLRHASTSQIPPSKKVHLMQLYLAAKQTCSPIRIIIIISNNMLDYYKDKNTWDSMSVSMSVKFQ